MKHHPWVEQNLSHVTSLIDMLDMLDGRSVTVRVYGAGVHGADIDRIHEGLLRKQRATGSLGLNE